MVLIRAAFLLSSSRHPHKSKSGRTRSQSLVSPLEIAPLPHGTLRIHGCEVMFIFPIFDWWMLLVFDDAGPCRTRHRGQLDIGRKYITLSIIVMYTDSGVEYNDCSTDQWRLHLPAGMGYEGVYSRGPMIIATIMLHIPNINYPFTSLSCVLRDKSAGRIMRARAVRHDADTQCTWRAEGW
jgi:hypothetical protein